MVEIADLRDCAPSGLFYGGRAGRKEGILIEGEPWIAKYPRTTRDLAGKHLPSYTSSPVSEYLGSHIYELLGIPVHETMLGYRAGKIVCACRDFTFPNARLFEFKEIKNALSDDDAGFSSVPSDGARTSVLRSATCSPPLSALRQPWIWRPSMRLSTACRRKPTVSCCCRSRCAKSTSAF